MRLTFRRQEPCVRLFRRAFCVSLAQSAGVVLLTSAGWVSVGALVTAFSINWMWTQNVHDSVDYRQLSARWSFAVGATCGTGLVLLLRWVLARS